MSEQQPPSVPLVAPPPVQPSPQQSPPPRHGCLTAFMVLFGIVMLLPGFCALLFGFGSLTEGHFDSGFAPLILIGLLVGAGGILLIRAGLRAPRR
jgi:hypothetical protein